MEVLFRNGPRADCASLANLSEEWATAEQDSRADCASLAILSWVMEGSSGGARGTIVGVRGSCGRGIRSDMRRKQSVWSNGNVWLPVVWGPRTRAGAAALMIGVGTRAGGVAALGCSCDTDPSKVLAGCKEGIRKDLSRSQKGLCGGCSCGLEFVAISSSGNGERDTSSSGGTIKLVSGLVSGVSRGVELADCRGSGAGGRSPDMRRRGSAH